MDDVDRAIVALQSGEVKSRREAAREYGVPEATIRYRLNKQDPGHTTMIGGSWPTTGPTLTPDGLPADSDMAVEIPVIHRDYTSLEKLNVYPLGDVHKGSPYHAEERWHEWLDYLANTDAVSLLNTGDNFNVAIIGSKSDVYAERLTVPKAKIALRHELQPLADQGKIDVLMPGNHEDRIYRSTGDDPVFDLADSLKVPYAASAVLLVYHVGEQEYEVFVRHGTGNYPGKMGTQLNQLQQGLEVVQADVYVTGHTHSQTVGTADRFYRRGDRMVRQRHTFMSSGSFLNYERYAAQRGYVPSRIGAPRIYLDGTRKDIHVSV
jgi:hypothetical protein